MIYNNPFEFVHDREGRRFVKEYKGAQILWDSLCENGGHYIAMYQSGAKEWSYVSEYGNPIECFTLSEMEETIDDYFRGAFQTSVEKHEKVPLPSIFTPYMIEDAKNIMAGVEKALAREKKSE